MKRLDATRLSQLLQQFPRLSIGLLGDLFLDRYLEIEPSLEEVSIETGRAAHQVVSVRNSAGALGTVINNLVALGVGRIVPVTVIGDDGHGDDLMRCLRSLPVETAHILRRQDRLTPTYTKPLEMSASGTAHELNRLDVRTRVPLSDDAHRDVARHWREVFATCDGWIVLDQVPERNAGVVDGRMREILAELTRREPDRFVLIDSRMRLGDFPHGSPKGNRHEFLQATGRDRDSLVEVSAAARELAQRAGRTAYCTVGEHGMLVARAGGDVLRVAGIQVTGPIDIVGAGDAASSGLTAATLAGAADWEAALVANLAASITVQQLGTTGVATPAQLQARLEQAGCPAVECLDDSA